MYVLTKAYVCIVYRRLLHKLSVIVIYIHTYILHVHDRRLATVVILGDGGVKGGLKDSRTVTLPWTATSKGQTDIYM